jgi:hypothetical protein
LVSALKRCASLARSRNVAGSLQLKNLAPQSDEQANLPPNFAQMEPKRFSFLKVGKLRMQIEDAGLCETPSKSITGIAARLSKKSANASALY